MLFAWSPHYIPILRFHHSINLRIGVIYERSFEQHVGSKYSRDKPIPWSGHGHTIFEENLLRLRGQQVKQVFLMKYSTSLMK